MEWVKANVLEANGRDGGPLRVEEVQQFVTTAPGPGSEGAQARVQRECFRPSAENWLTRVGDRGQRDILRTGRRRRCVRCSRWRTRWTGVCQGAGCRKRGAGGACLVPSLVEPLSSVLSTALRASSTCGGCVRRAVHRVSEETQRRRSFLPMRPRSGDGGQRLTARVRAGRRASVRGSAASSPRVRWAAGLGSSAAEIGRAHV